jgi:hypothetical protein
VGHAPPAPGLPLRDRLAAYLVKLALGGFLLAVFETRSPRCACSACRSSSALR